MAYSSLIYVENQAAMLNQPWAHVGDTCYRYDTDEVFTLIALPASELANWQASGVGAVSSVFGRIGVVVAEDDDYDFAQIAGQLPQSQLATPTPDWLNVKQFGAKGDTQFVTDAATSGSNIVSSATANFKSTDVGKLCWVVQDSSGLLIVGQGTIASVISATEITVTGAFNAGYSFLRLVWGSDDTAALIAASNAATATAPNGSGKRTVYCPSGGYIFQSRPFNNVGDSGAGTPDTPGYDLRGDGVRNTCFYPSPNFDFTSTSGNGGMLVANVDCFSATMSGFSVDGSNIPFTSSGAENCYLLDLSSTQLNENLLVERTNGNLSGINGDGTEGVWINVQASYIQSATSYGIGINIVSASGAIFLACQGGNCAQNMVPTNITGGLHSGGGIIFIGGEIYGVELINSTGVIFHGTQFYSPASGYALTLTDGSSANLFGCAIGPNGGDDFRGGISIDATSSCFATQSRFLSQGTGFYGVLNAGTFHNDTGNSISNVSGGGTFVGPSTSVYDVKNYGAKGDARAVTDGVTSGSATLSSATANFTAGDVGKVIWAVKPGFGSTLLAIATGTVATFVSSTEITVATSSFTASETGLVVVLGTDDTASLQAAYAAALAAQNGDDNNSFSGTKTVYIPAGGYIFQEVAFTGANNKPLPNILGDGPSKTVFFPSPAFNFSSGFQPGFGMLNYYGGGTFGEMGNFTVNASFITWAGSNYGALVDGNGFEYIHDIVLTSIADVSSSGSYIGGIAAAEGISGLWRNVTAVGCNANTNGGYGAGIYINGATTRSTLQNCGGSNGTQGMYLLNINNGTSLQDDGGGLLVIGCLNDEGSAVPQVYVSNCSDTTFVGCSLFGNGSPSLPIYIDGTSDVTFFGCVIGPYSYRDDSGALQIAVGGTVRASGCRIHSSGSGVALVNAGTFYDLGGNEVSSITNTGSIISTAQFVAVPATSTSAGVPGQMAYASGYLYVCITANVWQRTTLATF